MCGHGFSNKECLKYLQEDKHAHGTYDVFKQLNIICDANNPKLNDPHM